MIIIIFHYLYSKLIFGVREIVVSGKGVRE